MIVEWQQKVPDLGVPVAKVHNSVYAAALHRPSGELWIGHNFEGIHVIDPIQKKSLRSLQLGNSPIFDIKFCDAVALVAGGDGIISVIDTKTFAFIKHLKASNKSVRSIAVHPNGKEFAAAYSDNFVRVFSVADYSLIKELNGHTKSVFSVHYSPDGKLLLSAGRDAKLIAWDAERNYEKHTEIIAHLFAINDIAFRPDGNYFATCSMDKSIKIWDAAPLKLLKVIDRGRFAGHGTSINKLLWTDFENQLLACSDDRTISAWEIIEA